MPETLKDIELKILAILTKARKLELEKKRKMSVNEKNQFRILSKKYPSEGFFLFNLTDGFLKGVR